MTFDHPVILVHLRMVGQAATVDTIELTKGPNDHGDEREAWRIAHLLLLEAAARAAQMSCAHTQGRAMV